MFGAIMFVPFFMQGIVGVSAAESGTIMTPMMITMIVDEYYRWSACIKSWCETTNYYRDAFMAGGFWLLTTMDMHTTKLTATFYMSDYRFRNGSCYADINISVTRKVSRKKILES